MSLVNYVKYSNPTSHKDVLSKLRTFALDRGWTVDYYETSKQWAYDSGSSQYDFLSGQTYDHDNLQIYTNGYGNQDVVVRFRADDDSGDPQEEQLWVRGIDPSYRNVDHSNSDDPISQNFFTGTYFQPLSLSPGTMPAVWFFGNDKFICGVVQVASNFIQTFFCGVIELFDQSTNDGIWEVSTCYYSASSNAWYNLIGSTNMNFACFWSPDGDSSYYYKFWFEGDKTAGRIDSNCGFGADDGYLGEFNKLSYCVRQNAWTGKRVLIKPTLFGQRRSDNVWYPIGTYPFYCIEFAGLQIGQELTYGSERYIVFPTAFPDRQYGFAFRIA